MISFLLLFLMCNILIIANPGTLTDITTVGCDTPIDPINGRVVVYGDNLLVEYFCDDDFHMYGESFGACMLSEGKWTIDPPKCLAYDCPEPEAPPRGYVQMEKNNSIAKFSCKRRHYLMGGEATLYCLGNRWSGYSPICVAAKVSGSSLGKQTLRNDSKQEEKLLNFDDALRGSDQTCSRYRFIAPPDIDSATYKTRYMFNEVRRVWSSVANYTCDDGFELESEQNRYMFCRSYRWWAPIKPKCKKAVKIYQPCSNNRCSQICIPGDSRQYACACNRGYHLGPDGLSCEDENECLINNGGCGHLCYNTHGSRLCVCHEGYLRVGDDCIDMDECSSGTHDCPGQCINTDGSYTCNCTGISGYQSGVNRPCKDLDECATDNGGCEDICVNTVSSYRCRCKKKGYVLSDDRHHCSDRDECKRYGKKICHQGTCVNVPGSFYCHCHEGYKFHRPSKQCIDRNECKKKNGGCDDECVNTIGSFHCVCKHPGLQDSNGSCIDINECENENGGCQDVCINTHGSFICMCPEFGYVVDTNSRNCTTCKDSEYIDDDKKICIPCPYNSHTVNYTASTSAECVCNDGYVGSPVDGVYCEDIDECTTGALQCDYGCENTPGSAHCLCPEGYTVQNISTCIDIDECQLNKTICEGLCENLEGSFRCYCEAGYLLANDSISCEDINECIDGFNCSHKCTNTEGSAKCSCNQGYELDSDQKTCKDINECDHQEGMQCEDLCVNTEGSFRCVCSRGYKLSWDKMSCSDINECQEGVNYCEDICINTHGSYKCACNETGYVVDADGLSCVDFDECLSPTTNNCEQICTNIPSSYNCSCYPGYLQKEYSHCEICPIGTFHDVNENKCVRCPIWSTTLEPGQASMADCQCIDGYRGNLSLAVPCKDVNECEEDNFGCEQHCQNMEGSAYCSCKRGYNLDENKKNCTDIDECRYMNHFCSDICENFPGSYTCSCREGFKLYRDRKYCIDINECSENTNPCDQHCENTWGSYKCGCVQRGYVLDVDDHTCIENKPKLVCPEDVLVQLPVGAVEVEVELPSELFAENLVISPDWISQESLYPIGETLITVRSDSVYAKDNDEVLCTFRVSVQML